MSIDKRYLFPALLLLFNLGSAVMCFLGGDWKRGLYWLCSAGCICCVAFT